MGLFDVFSDIISMPIRITTDIIKIPTKIIDGEDEIFENTKK